MPVGQKALKQLDDRRDGHAADDGGHQRGAASATHEVPIQQDGEPAEQDQVDELVDAGARGRIGGAGQRCEGDDEEGDRVGRQDEPVPARNRVEQRLNQGRTSPA